MYFLFIGIAVCFFVFCLKAAITEIYDLVIEIYRSKLRYEMIPSVARINDKEYKNGRYFLCNSTKGRPISEIDPKSWYEGYFTYVICAGEEYYFNDRNLYSSAIVGNVVDIVVNKGYNKQGELKYTYISLP